MDGEIKDKNKWMKMTTQEWTNKDIIKDEKIQNKKWIAFRNQMKEIILNISSDAQVPEG